MEQVPRARAQDREKTLAEAAPEAEKPRSKAGTAEVPAAGRDREPAKVTAAVREKAEAALGEHNEFTGGDNQVGLHLFGQIASIFKCLDRILR
jgi:hypothetical protein